MQILAVDIGGSHVKVLASGQTEPRRMDSGRDLTAGAMVAGVKALAADWAYDVISMGFPGQVVHNMPAHEPVNLGTGWIGFDYEAAFGKPIRIINDAAMQALGSYEGGRMLFLGVGTGLGSAMIVDSQLEPMELGHLPYKNGKTYEDYIGQRGLDRLGKKRWREEVLKVIDTFRTALQPDYIILGGGHAKRRKELPPGVRLGDNANAFLGGFRLWQPDTQGADSGQQAADQVLANESPSP